MSEAATNLREITEKYHEWAKGYYRKPDGSMTTHVSVVEMARRRLDERFGDLPPGAITSPMILGFIEDLAENTDLARTTINKTLTTAKHFARWAVQRGYAPTTFFAEFHAVSPLKRGRTPARETDLVMPVEEADFEATLDAISSRYVKGLLRVLWFTGARVGELVGMRIEDIDRTRETWYYTLEQHKTAHHGKSRIIAFGGQAQAVLNDLIGDRDPSDYVFCSRRSIREVRSGKRDVPAPESRPIDRDYVNRAVHRACKKAGVERWHVHRIRHSAATRFVAQAGLDGARIALGHSDTRMTARYAEIDHSALDAIAKVCG